jgi:hypothetical protein
MAAGWAGETVGGEPVTAMVSIRRRHQGAGSQGDPLAYDRGDGHHGRPAPSGAGLLTGPGDLAPAPSSERRTHYRWPRARARCELRPSRR